jgi:hypothetical protein
LYKLVSRVLGGVFGVSHYSTSYYDTYIKGSSLNKAEKFGGDVTQEVLKKKNF